MGEIPGAAFAWELVNHGRQVEGRVPRSRDELRLPAELRVRGCPPPAVGRRATSGIA